MIAARVPSISPELGAGDDTAVLDGRAGPLLMTVDMLVEAVDFDLAYASGYDVGWKAVAVNVSDIAAMGGQPVHAVAALGLRPEVPVSFFNDVLEGLLAACERWGIKLAGGDLSGGSAVSLSLTLTGDTSGQPVLRSGAGVGDAICVTGYLGGSAGGLFVLQESLQIEGSSELIERHLRPQARAKEGMLIAAAGATAMIDVSDGLGIDLLRLMDASGTGCEVEKAAIPVDPALSFLEDAPDAPDAARLAISGGEDYELLFTIPEQNLAGLRIALDGIGTPLTQIGTVTGGAPRLDGAPLEEREELGWDHLRTR